jgi:hypothetical protein
VAHSVFLEGAAKSVVVIDPAKYPAKSTGSIPKGWTNDAIKTARDNARAIGKVPVLTRHMAMIENMVSEAHKFVASLRDDEPAIYKAFQPDGGMSEVTMIWREGETLCKARADRLSIDYRLLLDYKTCAGSVEPGRWARTNMAGMGNYLSASWYRRGLNALVGLEPDYVFFCQETRAPAHLCSIIGLDPSWLALGDEKIAYGLRRWQRCVASGKFAGYPTRVCYPEPPSWERAQWDGRLPDPADVPHGIEYGSQP